MSLGILETIRIPGLEALLETAPGQATAAAGVNQTLTAVIACLAAEKGIREAASLLAELSALRIIPETEEIPFVLLSEDISGQYLLLRKQPVAAALCRYGNIELLEERVREKCTGLHLGCEGARRGRLRCRAILSLLYNAVLQHTPYIDGTLQWTSKRNVLQRDHRRRR